jgi:aconitate hydratase
MSIYDAAMEYQNSGTPLLVIAGKEYGTGSSRDWAAKGSRLLGVRAVIAESFERIHRSNLAGMGVLPLQFKEGDSRKSLRLTGDESIDITGLDSIRPRMEVSMKIDYPNGETATCQLQCRLDTALEARYYSSSGIMPYVVNTVSITDASE